MDVKKKSSSDKKAKENGKEKKSREKSKDRPSRDATPSSKRSSSLVKEKDPIVKRATEKKPSKTSNGAEPIKVKREAKRDSSTKRSERKEPSTATNKDPTKIPKEESKERKEKKPREKTSSKDEKKKSSSEKKERKPSKEPKGDDGKEKKAKKSSKEKKGEKPRDSSNKENEKKERSSRKTMRETFVVSDSTKGTAAEQLSRSAALNGSQGEEPPDGPLRESSTARAREKVSFAKDEEEEEEYDYEDDFEDYDDDFEEESEEGEEGSAAASSPPSSPSPSPSPPPSRPSPVPKRKEVEEEKRKKEERRESSAQKGRIDFMKSSLSEAALAGLGRSRRREAEVGALVEMDTRGMDLFSLAPIRDYDAYIQNYGKSGRAQVQTQTGDEGVEREVETEEVENETKWTQHPPTDLLGVGGETSTRLLEETPTVRMNTEIFNNYRFKNFVQRSGTLVLDLMEEAETGSLHRPKTSKSGIDRLSSASWELSLGRLAEDASVSAISVAKSSGHIVAASFEIRQSPAKDIEGRSLTAIWNVYDPSTPRWLLLSDYQVLCSCFNSEDVTAFFAGLEDGSVVAWDLGEAESQHSLLPWDEETELALRTPTFHTVAQAALPGTAPKSSPSTPIVHILRVRSSDSGGGGSYQIAGLEASGTVHFWTVLESTRQETSELDLGLSPGGKLKLIPSAVMPIPAVSLRSLTPVSGGRGAAPLQAFVLAQSERDSDRFLIGTDTGFVLSLSRLGEVTGPKAYSSELSALADIPALQFSPIDPSLFLTGSSDGDICLYDTQWSEPVKTFRREKRRGEEEERGKGVTQLRWSPIGSNQFYALFGDSVALWDSEQSNPVVQFKLGGPASGMEFSHTEKDTLLIFSKETSVEVHIVKT